MSEATLPWPESAVTTGDERARVFEAALPRCARLAFRVAFAVLRQRAEAEDVTQEILARAFWRLGALRDPARLEPWIARAAFRGALDRRRGQLRRDRREEAAAVPPPEPTALDLVLRAEAEERVYAALEALPEKLRFVMILSALEGHDGPAIARLLGLPLGTVKSRLHLARRALAERLR